MRPDFISSSDVISANLYFSCQKLIYISMEDPNVYIHSCEDLKCTPMVPLWKLYLKCAPLNSKSEEFVILKTIAWILYFLPFVSDLLSNV